MFATDVALAPPLNSAGLIYCRSEKLGKIGEMGKMEEMGKMGEMGEKLILAIEGSGIFSHDHELALPEQGGLGTFCVSPA